MVMVRLGQHLPGEYLVFLHFFNTIVELMFVHYAQYLMIQNLIEGLQKSKKRANMCIHGTKFDEIN